MTSMLSALSHDRFMENANLVSFSMCSGFYLFTPIKCANLHFKRLQKTGKLERNAWMCM